MKMLIDISEEIYNKMRRGEALYPADANVAIFAIEIGTPLSESEDCISRQAVLEAIEDDNRNGHYSCFASNNDAQCFKQIIRELPPVIPAEKVGQWEWVQYDANPEIGNFHCSECRYIPATFNLSARRMRYCPNCGTKMQEVKE